MMHEILWAETQRLPLAPHDLCQGMGKVLKDGIPPRRYESPPTPLDCEPCGGTGEVRSDVYRRIEMAVTVPGIGCTLCGDKPHVRKGGIWHAAPDPVDIRIVRPQPGVMACHCHGTPSYGSVDPHAHKFSESCTCCRDDCGGSGTVPDPSEAGVVARLEACGRLAPIERLLYADVPFYDASPISKAWSSLDEALTKSDYPGALAATLAAVQAITKEAT